MCLLLLSYKHRYYCTANSQRLHYAGCVSLTFCFWCSGIRKDHCRAQWNLGRETAKDGGNPHGEVSIGGQCLLYSISVSQGGSDVGPTSASTQPPIAPSVFLPLCAVCLTFFTCLSHFPCTHSVSFRYLLCCHTLLHRHPSNTLSPPLFTHLWLQTSTVLLSVHWVPVVPISVVIPQITCFDVAHHQFLSSVSYQH